MAPQPRITVELAKALVLRAEGKTDAKIGPYIGLTAAQVRNSLLATAKRRGWVNRHKVDWELIRAEIKSGKVECDTAARSIIMDPGRCPDTLDLLKDAPAPSVPSVTPPATVSERPVPSATTVSEQKSTGVFSPSDIVVLQRIIAREATVTRGHRSGQTMVIRARVDSGLWAALETHKDAHGITLSEALTRAIERYLD